VLQEMIKDINSLPKLSDDSMLKQKTNQDFNDKKPNPKDPNEEKEHPDTLLPDFGENDSYPMETERPDKEKKEQKRPNLSEGSE